jgi:hypothetical protein
MLRTIHIGACALLATAIGCTQSYKPTMSTETGNPPVTIDSAKLALVVTRDEVHVQGEPGAVMPPEADVEITIVRTRDATLTDVEDDGSFDAEVDATLDDVFEVRAILDGMKSDVVIVVRGGSEVIDGDGGGLTCEQQTRLGSDILDSALAMADRTCETAADCMPFWRNASCISSCLGGYFSEEGMQSIADTVEAIDEGVCASFEDDGCMTIAPPCVPPLAAACIGGQCVEDDGSNNVGCETCFSKTLTWTPIGSGILPELILPAPRTLSGCNTLEYIDQDGKTCSSDLPQCPIPSGSIPVSSVLLALEHEDVVQAFEQGGGTFGYPEDQSGVVYELTLDGVTITYRSCAGSSAGVTCEPNGLEDLVTLLTTLGGEYTCISVNPDPDPEPSCTLPWADDNMCDAAIPRWWHDPQTGTCLFRTYGGCGGNGNSYASFEECLAACPPPSDSGACPPNRVFVEGLCLDCGPAGGCGETSNACILVCSEDAACEGEAQILWAAQTCSAEGVCSAVLGCD